MTAYTRKAKTKVILTNAKGVLCGAGVEVLVFEPDGREPHMVEQRIEESGRVRYEFFEANNAQLEYIGAP